MPRLLLMVLLVVVLVFGASVGYFNAQPVRFNYLFGELELPLIAILIGDFAFGVGVTLLVLLSRLLSLRLEAGRLRRRLRDTESELRALRNLPVAPEAPR